MGVRSGWPRSTVPTLLALVLLGGCAIVVRSSVTPTGGSPDGPSREPTLDATGRFVAFTSDAGDLVAGDADGVADVFRRDHLAGSTVLVSVDVDGGPADGPSGNPRISAGGARVAFTSDAGDLVPGDAGGATDVFLRDVEAGVTERVSVADDGTPLDGPSGSVACRGLDEGCVATAHGLDIDAAGRSVAFVSIEPASGRSAALVRHLDVGTTATVLVAPVGGRVEEVAVAGDGSRVAVATRLPDGGSGEVVALSLVDVADGAVTPIATRAGDSAPVAAFAPVLSTDGGRIAFLSDEPLVPEDDPVGQHDVDAFVVATATGAVERVSVAPGGAEVDGGVADLSMDGDGGIVAWSTTAAIGGAPGGVRQTFVHHRGADTTQLAFLASGQVAVHDAVGTLSSDGSSLALATDAPLASGDGGPPSDVVLRPALVPVLLGRAEVQAGATGATVELDGVGLTASTTVMSASFDVVVDDVAVVAPDRLAVTVSTMPGAALGPRSLIVTAGGPYGTVAAAPCTCVSLTWPYEAPAAPPERPSFIVINTDDQRFDSIDQMGLIDGRTDWLRFDRSYVHEPMCCPSRATLFTGQLGLRNQVLTLRDGHLLDDSATLATMLDGVGYRTLMAGKYVNAYDWSGVGPDGHPPGWDRVVAFLTRSSVVGPEVPVSVSGYPYLSYRNLEDGVGVDYGTGPWDYSTDRYAAATREFLRETGPDEPFLAYLAPVAPHFTVRPAARHRGSCAGRDLAPRPSAGAVDAVSEPDWMAIATAQDPAAMAAQLRATCEALHSVDEAVASLLVELEAAGRLDSTYVVFTSDNGYAFGEHRLSGKGHLYEESIRVPLLVLGPDVVPGSTDRLTTNADLAPTLLELAGVAPPPGHVFDGTSFADDLRGLGTTPDPEEVLLIGCRTGRGAGNYCGSYREHMGWALGLVTDRYKYVEYLTSGDRQLFDLAADPYELTNLVDDPAHVSIVADLDVRLAARTSSVGTLRGTVVEEGAGAGLAGVLVEVRTGTGGWRWSSQTDGQGRFALPPLPPGDYVVRFTDTTGGRVVEHHDDVVVEGAATPVAVVGGGTTVVDAALASSG